MGILSIIGSVFGFLTGPLKSFLDYRTQKAIVEGQVAQESIRANVELSQIKYHMHQINMGWWATRWIVPLIAYPIIAWWIAVFADTIFQFPNFSVAAPPEPIYSWTGEILMSFFIVRGTEVVANAAIAWGALGTIGGVISRVFGTKK